MRFVGSVIEEGDLEKEKGSTAASWRELGGRRYKMRLDEVTIDRRDDWELNELTSLSDGDWMTIRLLDVKEGDRADEDGVIATRKRSYQLGYNKAQGRMARNVQIKVLERCYPDVCEWVLLTLRGEKK